MSRGLGTAQRLILTALASLEEENGEGHRFLVWAIVDRLYELSPELQDLTRSRNAASEARNAAIRARADAGDDKARLYLSLGRALSGGRRNHPRKRRTAPWAETETALNPSRVLASLERRGLVTRNAIKGGGAAGLTDAGRSLATVLSFGSSCAETTGSVVGSSAT